ncbi:MAG TPA: SDR family oxidoreductase [Streptosporangiaceae bacterium]|nr:SDR family oxidoreductase [Streptosporangiaceae bacterium]
MTARRLIVVSGGGTGIGRAIARRFAADGDDVIIVGRRAGRLADAAAEINAQAQRAAVTELTADLREPGQVERLAASVTRSGRAVDVLVNNAGGNFAPGQPAHLAGIRESWRLNVEGNVLPVVLLTAALLPAIRRPGGAIVTISSVAATRGPASYGGAKAALHLWSTHLAGELAGDGITVNVAAPGYVTGTEFYGARMNPEFHAGRARQAPMNRGADPAEVAGLVWYLAASSARFITGQVIGIDGGALIVRQR